MREKIKIEYEQIKEMRDNIDAPVDTMGCHLFCDDKLDKNISNFHIIVGAFLSSQTQDKITYSAMQRLKKRGLSIDFILDTPLNVLANLLKPVGFYNKKAKMLKTISSIFKNDFDYKPPTKYEDLIKLPGIGPKIAVLIDNVLNKEKCGICVDTHVHRITNRIGWVKTKKPEETRKKLENILDKENWDEINYILVGFGQTICKARKPNCSECLLNKTCNYYKLNK